MGLCLSSEGTGRERCMRRSKCCKIKMAWRMLGPHCTSGHHGETERELEYHREALNLQYSINKSFTDFMDRVKLYHPSGETTPIDVPVGSLLRENADLEKELEANTHILESKDFSIRAIENDKNALNDLLLWRERELSVL